MTADDITDAQQTSITEVQGKLGGPEEVRFAVARDEPHDTHIFVEFYRRTDDGWQYITDVIIDPDGTYEPPAALDN
ncbi:MAG: hypothetical protein JHD16_00290 [Solirubrobacteraceae bacterium]|nr:hypothetical protein [Solirubrobacteraceae bacterium]